MLIRHAPDLTEAHVTPKQAYVDRRHFLAGLGAVAGAALLPVSADAAKLSGAKSAYSTDEKQTSFEDVTSYNNFYEFGTDKSDPAAYAGKLTTTPWSIKVDGLVNKPATYALEEFIKPYRLEERIYRHRCVEAWSMIVPWTGFPLADLVAYAKPLSGAKYIRMETFLDPAMAPGQNQPFYPWPYVEGLSMAEANNELAFMVTGVYGKPLLKQMGAPIRLHTPWKYGFKSVKSIVKVSFVEERPINFWQQLQSSEYGFWANVNPDVPHPRWSQASETVIGTNERIPTRIYNGYGEFVAGLYKGMESEPLFM